MKVTFPLNNLQKPSQILRKAAELVELDVLQNPGAYQFMREGACFALSEVEGNIQMKKFFSVTTSDESYARLNRKVRAGTEAVEEAREIFGDLFMPKRKNRGDYWFGAKFTDKEQQHRVLALLTAAEVAESMGK